MDIENLSLSFEKLFHIKLQKPLSKSGEIQNNEFKVNYFFKKDTSGKTVLDFLIFDRNGFPPIHKRIDANGELRDLENFQFSLMYESQKEREEEELKMRKINTRTAHLIISKGLADYSDEWIHKYL